MAADAKQTLVEATIDALGQLTVADLVSAIGTRDIARRAGLSQPTVFHHFGSVEQLAAAVLARVFDPGVGIAQLGSTGEQFEGVRSSVLPGGDVVGLHRSEFRRVSQDPELRARMGLWAFGGPQGDAAYREYLRAVEAAVAVMMRPVLDRWGREVRPPYDLPTFIALHVALVNGSSVRHLIDPTTSHVELFARSATALTMVGLRVKGDRHDLGDRLAEMNYYPTRHPAPGEPTSDRRGRTRARIFTATAELFATRGFDGTTVAQIARAAGLGVSTVHEHFPTKAVLAAALFRQRGADLVLDRAPLTGSADDRLRRHLEDVATLAAGQPECAPAYLSELVCHAPAPGSGDALRTATQELMVDDDGADLVLSAVISRVLGRPFEGAELSVRAVLTRVVVETRD